jgi:hypothetical protein
VSKISYIYERREYYKRGSIFYVKHPGSMLIPNLRKGGKVRETRVLRVGEEPFAKEDHHAFIVRPVHKSIA